MTLTGRKPSGKYAEIMETASEGPVHGSVSVQGVER